MKRLDQPYNETQRQRRRRGELLLDTSEKPVIEVAQLDAFADSGEIRFTRTTDLRRVGSEIRVQILDGTTRQDALRLLRKLRRVVRQDWDRFQPPPGFDEDDPPF